MDDTQIKHVLEAALFAAGRPVTLDKLGELFPKRSRPDKQNLQRLLEMLVADYEGRGIELKEVASGYRIQIKQSMNDWLTPLWDERAPRYSRALLETLSLIAYRQPITRGDIEAVRGVAVTTGIIRTLLERDWIRVVGHREVPGRPAMFGTTREFLDYFGLKKLDDLPPLSEIKDLDDFKLALDFPDFSPQIDLVDGLEDEQSDPAAHEDAALEAAQLSAEDSGDDGVIVPISRPEPG
jgi:segregation and condensation protein B